MSNRRCILRSPRHLWRRFRFSSPSIAFTFGIVAFQIRRSQAAFHGSSSSGSHGTLTLTIKASPSTNIDRSHNIAVSLPSTIFANVGPIICRIAMFARWAFLAGVSWVNHLHLDAESRSFVGDELCELIERPAIGGAVVFLGRSPTTCTCRALTYSLKGFDSDRCHTRSLGRVHNLAGYLVVDILHPAAFLVLGPLDRFLFLEALQLLSASIECAALVPHLSPVAIEPCRFPSDIGNRWDFDACVYSHDDLALCRLCIWKRCGCIGYPLLILPLDP